MSLIQLLTAVAVLLTKLVELSIAFKKRKNR